MADATTTALEARLTDSTGYGTLGHLLSVIVHDRESFENTEAFIAWAEANAGELWDGIIAPALDRIERAYTDDTGVQRT